MTDDEDSVNTPTNIIDLRPAAVEEQRQEELTGAIGMMVALGSWAMMFGALFFIYLALRSQAVTWPPPGLPRLPVLLPAINTMVIIGSSFTLAHALERMRKGHNKPALSWMAVTLGLGLLFVALQVVLWRNVWLDGITASTGTLGTVFYGLTVLHALHVAAGVIVLGYLLVAALRSVRGAAMQKKVISLRLCGMFWHFVDAVWCLMFVGLFLT